ncbi:MAG: sigma-70 family RNA polymerase sigma factor [Sandaracinaceae bacterium]
MSHSIEQAHYVANDRGRTSGGAIVAAASHPDGGRELGAFDPVWLNEVVQRCQPMVRAIARPYAKLGMSASDLQQEGALGLLDAALRFDPGFGARFSTYARWWVRCRIQRYLQANRAIVALPDTRQVRLARRKLRATTARLESERQCSVTSADVAEELGIAEEDVALARAELRHRDMPVDYDGDLRERAADTDSWDPTPEDIVAREERRRLAERLVRSVLCCLDERERFIVRERQLRDTPRTLRELGEELSISSERVRQLEQRALDKMHSGLCETGRLAMARRCAAELES